jgi:hypothetical protein
MIDWELKRFQGLPGKHIDRQDNKADGFNKHLCRQGNCLKPNQKKKRLNQSDCLKSVCKIG